MIKRVLLIQPPYTILKHEPKGSQAPLGLAYIAAVLEKNYEVAILDAVAEGFNTESFSSGLLTYGLTDKEIAQRIRDYAPDMVGVSCLFSTQLANAHRLCEIVKKINPGITTVMGGAHPSALPAKTLEDENIDYVIIGEGDFALAELIERLNAPMSLTDMDGIAFRSFGKIEVNPKAKYIENLDTLPFPARHLLPMDKYFSINRPHGTTSIRSPNTSIITSRGCPAKCVFCSIHSVWGDKFRARSPQNVLEEIEQLIRGYGIRELQFEDDNLTFNASRAKSIFREIKDAGFDIAWTTPNGVAAYALDDEMLELMKKSGCYRICLAVESGNEEVLHKIIRKPLKLSIIKPLIKKANELEIKVDAFFVVGFPGETKEQMSDTFNFANGIGAENVNFFMATPYPGTKLYEICKERGYLSENFSYEGLRVGQSSICTPEFTAAELERIVAREALKFRLKQLRKPSVFFDRVIKRLFIDPRFFFNYARKLGSRLAQRSN